MTSSQTCTGTGKRRKRTGLLCKYHKPRAAAVPNCLALPGYLRRRPPAIGPVSQLPVALSRQLTGGGQSGKSKMTFPRTPIYSGLADTESISCFALLPRGLFCQLSKPLPEGNQSGSVSTR